MAGSCRHTCPGQRVPADDEDFGRFLLAAFYLCAKSLRRRLISRKYADCFAFMTQFAARTLPLSTRRQCRGGGPDESGGGAASACYQVRSTSRDGSLSPPAAFAHEWAKAMVGHRKTADPPFTPRRIQRPFGRRGHCERGRQDRAANIPRPTDRLVSISVRRRSPAAPDPRTAAVICGRVARRDQPGTCR